MKTGFRESQKEAVHVSPDFLPVSRERPWLHTYSNPRKINTTSLAVSSSMNWTHPLVNNVIEVNAFRILFSSNGPATEERQDHILAECWVNIAVLAKCPKAITLKSVDGFGLHKQNSRNAFWAFLVNR